MKLILPSLPRRRGSRFSLRIFAFLLACVNGVAASTPVTPGRVVAWGRDPYGYGTLNVPSLSDAIAVAAGRVHGLALRSDATVLPGGAISSSGELYQLPHFPASVSNIVAIAVTSEASMALKADGTVVVWGQGLRPDWTNIV